LRLQAGIVISASHNPFEDNGIKFFSSDGNKLPDATEEAIEAEFDQPLLPKPSAQLGKASRVRDADGRYIEFCKSTFPSELDLRGLRVVVDCAHGATYHIASHVFHELGAEVFPSAPIPTASTSMTNVARPIRRRCGPPCASIAPTSASPWTATATGW
jgi:phosphoglucosamine mutase